MDASATQELGWMSSPISAPPAIPPTGQSQETVASAPPLTSSTWVLAPLAWPTQPTTQLKADACATLGMFKELEDSAFCRITAQMELGGAALHFLAFASSPTNT